MTDEVERIENPEIIDNKTLALPGLANEINQEHELAKKSIEEAQQHILRCGELLMIQRSMSGHGEWIKWVRENCKFGERTAQNYMRICVYAKHVSYWEFESASMRGMLRQIGKGPKLSPTQEEKEYAFSWAKEKEIAASVRGFESIKQALNYLRSGVVK